MGSYSIFSINNCKVETSKNDVISSIISIYSENDKKITYNKEKEEEDIKYQMTCKQFSEKLNIIGFDLKKVKEEFLLMQNTNDSVNFETYLECLKIIFDLNLNYHYSEKEICLELKELGLYEEDLTNEEKLNASKIQEDKQEIIKYMISSSDYYWWFGIPLKDIRSLIQMILSTQDDNKIVEYDVSNLINSGYFYKDYYFSENAKDYLREEHLYNEKIIILTEGKSDVDVLKRSLNHLYPHLSECYSFLDYNLANMPGSTTEVIRAVKAFIASGIANKVIAIFDNDTAGEEALLLLNKLKLPKNFRIMKYPDLEIAKKYPTLGPNGEIIMDVNSCACSLEMYLGENILKENNKFIPIQWKGYNEKLGKYQGVISKKDHVKNSFLELLKKEEYEKIDWSGIKLIWSKIFNSFS